MNALIICDSLYGNTEKIAHAIADGVAAAVGDSGSVECVRVGEAGPDQLGQWDLLVVGGPTHGSNPSPPMRDFLDRIPNNALIGVKVAAFDTRTDMEKLTGMLRLFGKFLDRLGYAAPKIASGLESKGGRTIGQAEGFIVLDKEGPLLDGELERATEWGRGLTVNAVSGFVACPSDS
jgi:flavodoxin